MRNLLASFLALHWSAAFALAALLSASGPSGIHAALAMLGGASSGEAAGWWSTPLTAGMLSTILAVVALLFFWVFVTTMFGGAEQDSDDAARIAYASAVVIMTGLLVGGVLAGVSGLAGTIALYITGLGVSYIAVAAEIAIRRSRPAAAPRARMMALGAALEAPFGRISGREPTKAGRS